MDTWFVLSIAAIVSAFVGLACLIIGKQAGEVDGYAEGYEAGRERGYDEGYEHGWENGWRSRHAPRFPSDVA